MSCSMRIRPTGAHIPYTCCMQRLCPCSRMASGCGTGKVGFKLDVKVAANTTYCEPCCRQLGSVVAAAGSAVAATAMQAWHMPPLQCPAVCASHDRTDMLPFDAAAELPGCSPPAPSQGLW